MRNGNFLGRWKKVFGLVGVAVVMLTVLAAATGVVRFSVRRGRAHGAPVAVPVLSTDPAILARGDHLAHTLGGCAHCHGQDFGGRDMGDEPVMHVIAPNLTRGKGSAVLKHTPRDWARAIAHGVDRSGHSLLVMPSAELAKLADDDISAIVAYFQTVPPVDRDLGKTHVTALGQVIFGLTNAEVLSAEKVDHKARRREAPPAQPDRAYGEYLSGICRGCHGADLRGGLVLHPGAPPAANISPTAMAAYDFAAFERALRTGVARDGRTLNDAMPWQAMRGLTPDEMRALWLGLRHD